MVKKRLEPDEAIFPDARSDPHPLQAVLQVQNSLAPTGQSTTETAGQCLLLTLRARRSNSRLYKGFAPAHLGAMLRSL
jgi:hypothetical protein